MKKLIFISIALLIMPHIEADITREIKIKIALYDSISPSVNLVEKALHYSWKSKNTRYEMDVKRIDFLDVINGNLFNYDVLVIGASGRQYFHGLFPKWKENVKRFIENGGGYVGICGGANIMSKGYEKPRYILDYIINIASLGIVDAYINDEQNEEWQYLWKESGGVNIPIKNILLEHPIFDGEKERYITYGGGPGLYGMQRAKAMAIYDEEPMEVAPLHYWIWAGKWIPYKKIKTDIKGYYSAAEITYGKGKIVVFGMHPEIPPRLNGSVEEFFGLSIYGIPRFVYAWKGGKLLNFSYNWWILRRSIAYVRDLPLPPVDEICVFVSYENGKIKAYAENADKVEFYVDEKLI